MSRHHRSNAARNASQKVLEKPEVFLYNGHINTNSVPFGVPVILSREADPLRPSKNALIRFSPIQASA
ncbi:hypothetical protein [Methylobacterium mesophilicum]|uniref:hypothetical protein n=1 Tax=Methylobacterium mesophilicum TaxID=39956 RepID=UPI002F351476